MSTSISFFAALNFYCRNLSLLELCLFLYFLKSYCKWGCFPDAFLVCLLLVSRRDGTICLLLLLALFLSCFYWLILCLPVVLKVFIGPTSFLVETLRSPMSRIISEILRILWVLFFLYIPFISFSRLIPLIKTSKTILNKNGNFDSHFLVPNSSANVLFVSFRMMSVTGLSRSFYSIDTLVFWS